ncbi:MAG: hypothetical protein OEW77_05980, partial [Gemmatimonadota bacterium]|nr:hypothetical protein [Gemmatimonadota bacterium]
RDGESLTGQSWWMLAGNRVIGAEWLAEAGRFAPADSLMRFTRSYAIAQAEGQAIEATYGASQLLRSRISEGLGNRVDAIAYARIFLAAFDKGGPEAQGRVKEARDRITRLGGTLEGLPVPPTPTGAP